MPKTNVLVEIVEGEKKVFLRSFEHDIFPRRYSIVKESKARDIVYEHERTCDFEKEAEHYFDMLKQE